MVARTAQETIKRLNGDKSSKYPGGQEGTDSQTVAVFDPLH